MSRRKLGAPTGPRLQVLPFNATLNGIANKIVHERVARKVWHPRGNGYPAQRKFSEQEVREMRKASARKTRAELAQEYGVSIGAINNIIRGHNYAWII